MSGYSYIYDAEGNRVSKQGSAAVDHIFLGGRELARLAGGQWTDLIYGANGLLAEVPGTQAGAPVYRMVDHLGTAVGTLDANGTLLSTSDYEPFGALFAGGSTDPYQFTGKEHDAESGNDYFGARYYSSAMGRFMSPDWSAKVEPVPYSKLDDPQTLNLYAYVGNNPLSRTDPDGHLQEDKHGKVKFHATGTGVGKWSFTDSKGNKVTITQKYKTGTVTTDDGHQVAAQKASGKMNVSITNSDGKTIGKGMSGLNAELGPGWSAQADCHGTTFAHGQLWINNDQVPSILSGDGYHSTTTPGVGDVGIYSRGDAVTPGSVDHSVRVSGTDASGDVTSVTSKGGITPKVETTPSGGWSDQSDSLTYYTQTKP